MSAHRCSHKKVSASSSSPRSFVCHASSRPMSRCGLCGCQKKVSASSPSPRSFVCVLHHVPCLAAVCAAAPQPTKSSAWMSGISFTKILNTRVIIYKDNGFSYSTGNSYTNRYNSSIILFHAQRYTNSLNVKALPVLTLRRYLDVGQDVKKKQSVSTP